MVLAKQLSVFEVSLPCSCGLSRTVIVAAVAAALLAYSYWYPIAYCILDGVVEAAAAVAEVVPNCGTV